MIPGFIGNPGAVEFLRRRVAGLQHGHAFLLHGEAHLGKQTLATAFIMGMNCQERRQEGLPCGRCASCDRIARRVFPYAFRLESHWGEIPVDALRERVRSLGLRPPEGVTQFLLVDDAGQLNASGANMLLKTLEEPPPDTILLLITRRIERILPTIRSRCQEVPLRRVPRRELAQLLTEMPEDGERLLDLVEGRPGLFLRLREAGNFQPTGDLFALTAQCWGLPVDEDDMQIGPLGPDFSRMEDRRQIRLVYHDELAGCYLKAIRGGDLWELLAAAACMQAAIQQEDERGKEQWEILLRAAAGQLEGDVRKAYEREAKERLQELREREIHGILHSLIRQLRRRAAMAADEPEFRRSAAGITRLAALLSAHQGIHLRSDRLLEEAGLELRRLWLDES